MTAVAGAGFTAIALDMRGYRQSSAPVEAEAYTPYQTVVDLVALLDAAGVATAVLVGHDFGANVAWNAAMMRPDRFSAACGVSVQFRQPGGPSFLDSPIFAASLCWKASGTGRSWRAPEATNALLLAFLRSL